MVDGPALLEALRRKASAVPNANLDELRFGLAARERVRSAPTGTLVVTAADVMTAD